MEELTLLALASCLVTLLAASALRYGPGDALQALSLLLLLAGMKIARATLRAVVATLKLLR